ncbi:RHS repeat domain-containing protein [Niabella insulamsoli]|uniref:RHS repeat domain-containing protein n=1 Tax=Niabella insulamsoli TaxID=3144874 RepID=UPI0031FC6972
MLKLITALLLFFIMPGGYAQKVDWENAPLNPVPQGSDLRYAHLKGDLFQASALDYYTRDGKWFSYDSKDRAIRDAKGRVTRFINDVISTRDYSYDGKGNLIKIDFGNGAVETYEYDNSNRVIKCSYKDKRGARHSQYSYRKKGDLLIIDEVGVQYQGESYETERHFKNGLEVYNKSKGYPATKYTYIFDKKGNWISKSYINSETNQPLISSYSKKPMAPTTRDLIYYSEYDKGLSAWSVVLEDLLDGQGARVLLAPRLYLNGKAFKKLIFCRFNNDYVFFDSLSTTYYIARSAYLKTHKEGQKIAVEKLVAGTEVILLRDNTSILLVENGRPRNQKDNWKYIYEKTFYGVLDSGETKNYFFDRSATPQQTVAVPAKNKLKDKNAVWFYYSREGKKLLIYDNEKLVPEKGFSVPGKIAGTEDVVCAIDGVPKYVLLNFKNAGEKELSRGRYFNAATDKIGSVSNTSSTQRETKAVGSNGNSSAATTGTANKAPSAEAKAFLDLYRNNRNAPQHLKTYLTNLDKKWRQRKIEGDLLAQFYASLIEEVYNNEPYAAFELMMRMEKNSMTGIIGKLPTYVRNYIREKSRERVQKYSGSHTIKTN